MFGARLPAHGEGTGRIATGAGRLIMLEQMKTSAPGRSWGSDLTAAGIMPAVVAATGASPEWTVLAIGVGSVFCSHVNDPGFWLVRSYLGATVQDTFRTWSLLETLISVFGLAFVLVGSAVL